MGCEATDEEADADGGGSITYDEYLKVMTQKMLNKVGDHRDVDRLRLQESVRLSAAKYICEQL
eukprot:5517576-Amphidinium_carterae.1